ncbi:MAG: hypothetical protein RLZZ347_214 [Candidatus Parcubacteria bacterium]|jgi:hypothetical protein
MNPIVLHAIKVILSLFTLIGVASIIVGTTNWLRKEGVFGGVPLGLAGLIIGLGGLFLITR